MKTYPIALEISGPSAMWTRPDTGDAPVSYLAPTYSAANGIFESVCWLKSAEVVPARVEIFAPLVFHTYSTNYGGPLRKSKIMKKGWRYQVASRGVRGNDSPWTTSVNHIRALRAEILVAALKAAPLSASVCYCWRRATQRFRVCIGARERSGACSYKQGAAPEGAAPYVQSIPFDTRQDVSIRPIERSSVGMLDSLIDLKYCDAILPGVVRKSIDHAMSK
ncbi:MAG: CRISPR-associated protein Cas5 [Planctomycetota bacterium]|nr:CRISPR-associated protein Cas5 [Planctomycetota bacterium]